MRRPHGCMPAPTGLPCPGRGLAARGVRQPPAPPGHTHATGFESFYRFDKRYYYEHPPLRNFTAPPQGVQNEQVTGLVVVMLGGKGDGFGLSRRGLLNWAALAWVPSTCCVSSLPGLGGGQLPPSHPPPAPMMQIWFLYSAFKEAMAVIPNWDDYTQRGSVQGLWDGVLAPGSEQTASA